MMLRQLLATLLLMSSVAFASDISPQQTAARQYVYRVNTQDTSGDTMGGSAVIIAPKYALSAAHVFTRTIKAGGTITLYSPAGKAVSVRVIKHDFEKDLVLLLGELACPCVPIGSAPTIDQTVTLIGYPHYDSFEMQWLTVGNVQKVTNNHVYSLSAITSNGGSGGGLFAVQGGEIKLVGVLHGYGRRVEERIVRLYEGISISINPQTVQAFLSGTPLAPSPK